MRTCLFVLSFLTPCISFSQNPDHSAFKRNILKIAPQQFAVNSLKIGVERFNTSLSKSYSLYVTVRKDKGNQIQFPTGFDGLGGEFQYRAYLKPLATYLNLEGKAYTQGVYLSGYVQGNSFSGDQFYPYSHFDQNTGSYIVEPFNRHLSIGNWGAGFTIGFQRVLWEIIILDAYIGGGMQWSDVIGQTYGPPSTYYPEYFFSPNYNFTDPEFNGILPKAGIHIGIAL